MKQSLARIFNNLPLLTLMICLVPFRIAAVIFMLVLLILGYLLLAAATAVEYSSIGLARLNDQLKSMWLEKQE